MSPPARDLSAWSRTLLPPRRTAPENEWGAQVYREAGMEPPWERVYRDGVDVTEEDTSAWTWPCNESGRSRRR